MPAQNEKNIRILNGFESFVAQIDMSSETVKTYSGRVRRYLEWCQDTFSSVPEKLHRSNMLEFKSYLLNVKDLARETVNSYLAALRSYNEFLIETKVQEEMVFRKRDYLRVQTPINNPWDGEEEDVIITRQRILETGKRHSKRDFAIVTLMAYDGLRVSEVCGQLLEDVHLNTNELFVRSGKGDVSRTVTINQKVSDAIKEYLRVRGETDCPYLFVSQKGGRLQRQQVYRITKEYSEGKLSPHKNRHYFCSKSQEVGYSISETANQAGHKDPRTTLRYTHPSKKQLLEKANRM